MLGPPKQETMFQKKISPFVLCLVSLKTAVAGKGLRLPSRSNFFPIHIFVPIRFSPKNTLTPLLELLDCGFKLSQ